jgi:imidazolonepropionase-like amidohydrolase
MPYRFQGLGAILSPPPDFRLRFGAERGSIEHGGSPVCAPPRGVPGPSRRWGALDRSPAPPWGGTSERTSALRLDSDSRTGEPGGSWRPARPPAAPAVACRGILRVLLAALLLPATPAAAQLFERATVIENVALRLPGGARVESARIVVKGGRIEAIGPDAAKPLLARTIDGGGGVVTAGLTALGSQLALAPSRKADPRSVMADGVDRYDRDAIVLALSGGITAAVLVPDGVSGIQGVASLVRLRPGEDGGHLTVSEREVALCLDLDSEAGALSRLQNLSSIRKTFEAALAHREELDLYEESLETYAKELAEAVEAGKKDGGEGQAKEGGAKDDGAKEPAKDAGPKRPAEPKPREDLAVVLRVLDRELPLWVTAHRSADIWNAIELVREFDLDLVLVGGSEAHLVAEALQEVEATVLVGPAPAGAAAESGADRRRSPHLLPTLERHDIRWLPLPGANLHELLGDTVRLSRGCEVDALTQLTRAVPGFLGMGRRVGLLQRGGLADLVLWSGDPLTDPSARVRQVWCEGSTVFRDDAIVSGEEADDPPPSAPRRKESLR